MIVRTGFEAYGGAYFEGGSNEFIQILGFNDGELEEWGRDQAAAVAPIPTDAQPASAVFQAGCPMHCGDNSNGLSPRCRLMHVAVAANRDAARAVRECRAGRSDDDGRNRK